MHACCAVCSAYPIEKLREMGFEPVLYFFNPNIFPEEEFNRRLSELEIYAKKKKIHVDRVAVDRGGSVDQCGDPLSGAGGSE